MKTYLSLGLKEAQKIAEAILQVAKNMNIPVAVTVLDARGIRLISLVQDGALPIAPELSEAKARLAFKMNMATIELQKEGVNVADFGVGYSSFGGGVPIKDKIGRSWGFVGVSGADTGAEDDTIAMQGIKTAVIFD